MREIKYHTVSDGSRFVIIHWYENGLMNVCMRTKTKLTRRRRKAIAMACGLKLRDFSSYSWPKIKNGPVFSEEILAWLARKISN